MINRRQALQRAAMPILAGVAMRGAATSARVYYGTYTNERSQGIYTATIDLSTGAVSTATVAAVSRNPSFLAIAKGGFAYAVNEVGDLPGKTGGVTAFRCDHQTGRWTQINQVSSSGGFPCHISLSPNHKFAVLANYGGGNIASLPIAADGSLGKAVSVVQHTGSSVNKRRQNAPHAHSVNFSPDGKFVIAADLGTDKLYVYAFDQKSGALTPHAVPHFALTPGDGPRHFAFHPSGKRAFVINELTSTLQSLTWDASAGTLRLVDRVSTLPSGFTGENSTAEVVVHPSGAAVYGSNRGHNSIAGFQLDQKTGKLRLIGHYLTEGEQPRNFAIAPGGKFLLALNQKSGNGLVFAIQQDYSLRKLASLSGIGTPVCVRFA